MGNKENERKDKGSQKKYFCVLPYAVLLLSFLLFVLCPSGSFPSFIFTLHTHTLSHTHLILTFAIGPYTWQRKRERTKGTNLKTTQYQKR